ncbi:DUF4149 domain-containing protein [Lyngbya sp. PCC 8106]|uniref:DUF4149 domain-containing protein n=1 Tax=Lyngbya sp. (strain PCC 8106) TaxID=313612 RepID=UPI0000EAA2A8|nr:DUF4149 domain-containing protein [Lyngbya sp. PCC 8106]EAW36944.1 hypothetical protein L8106_21057 [Lyngbya sp. PCC 8106]
MTTFSKVEYNPSRWLTVILITLALWMGGSMVLDFVIMPSMYMTGMMNQSEFASAGSMIFSAFNRVEILCAAVGLTGLMALGITLPEGFSNRIRTLSILAVGLLAIALTYTYGLTPQMTALGLNLNLFNPVTEVPTGMNQLHFSYFSLELIKLTCVGIVLGWCVRTTRREAVH